MVGERETGGEVAGRLAGGLGGARLQSAGGQCITVQVTSPPCPPCSTLMYECPPAPALCPPHHCVLLPPLVQHAGFYIPSPEVCRLPATPLHPFLPGTHHTQVLQTSSPSYLLLASLDAARYDAVQTTAWVSAWTTSLKARRALEKISGLVLLDDAHVAASESVGGFDPLRVVVNVADLGLTGYEAAKWLEEAWGVVPEMSTLNVSPHYQ